MTRWPRHRLEIHAERIGELVNSKVDMRRDLSRRIGLIEQLDRFLEMLKGSIHHRLPRSIIVYRHTHILEQCC